MGEDSRRIIIGAGIEGSLLALALRLLRPDVPFRLIAQGLRVPPAIIMPVCLTGIDEDVRALLDPLIIRQWTRARLSSANGIQTIDTDICLVSLDQLIGEVEDNVPAAWREAGPYIARADHDARPPIDTREGLYTAGSELACRVTHRIASLDGKPLDHPVLLDLSLPVEDGALLQYFPLGGDLILVRSLHLSTPTSDGSRPREEVPDASPGQYGNGRQHFLEYVGNHGSRPALERIIDRASAAPLLPDEIPLLVPSSLLSAARWAMEQANAF